MKLLSKIPKDHKIIFAGDLVDRGPRSKKIIEFAIRNNVLCVLGNHDDMMVDYVLKEDRYDWGIWQINGGQTTLSSYKRDGQALEDHSLWLKSLPLKIDLGDAIVSHTGYTSNDKFLSLWSRSTPEQQDKFRIFGHTPQKSIKVNKYWVCIDTGCSYPIYGKLSAFCWPSKEIITVANID